VLPVHHWSWSRRTSSCLVVTWVASVVAVDLVATPLLLPVDVQFRWLSWQGLETLAVVGASWLIPGFVLGGWKALLVASGWSSVRTATDKVLIALFALWAIGWPVSVVVAYRLHAG
jgi:hypothetical protein